MEVIINKVEVDFENEVFFFKRSAMARLVLLQSVHPSQYRRPLAAIAAMNATSLFPIDKTNTMMSDLPPLDDLSKVRAFSDLGQVYSIDQN